MNIPTRIKRKMYRPHEPGNDNCCCKVCRQKVYTFRSAANKKKQRRERMALPPQTGKYEVRNPAILNFLRGKKR